MAPTDTISFVISVSRRLLQRSCGKRPPFYRASHEYCTAQNDLSKPIQYTTSKAANLSIKHNIGLESDRPVIPTYKRVIYTSTFFIFLVYFCILREENDIDEMLKGNPDHQSKYAELLDLNFKLQYCKKNNISTAALKTKINELKKELNIPTDD